MSLKQASVQIGNFSEMQSTLAGCCWPVECFEEQRVEGNTLKVLSAGQRPAKAFYISERFPI